MHLSLYHPSSMLFLPDPTCLHFFQSVSYLSLCRPCSKNLAPNAKKHVLGSTKRRTKSTSAEERIYQAHIHSISNAGRERWPISRCFKMLLDARLLKCKPKKSKLETVWKLNRRRRGTEHLLWFVDRKHYFHVALMAEGSFSRRGWLLVALSCLSLEWNTANSIWSGGTLFAPKSLHQLIQSEAARQAEEADRTPLSCCHMVPRVVPLFVLRAIACL